MAQSTHVYDLGPVEDSDVPFIEPLGAAPFATSETPPPTRDAQGVLETIQNLNRIRDLDTLLEQVLLRARQLVRADAGTIYLKAKNRLFFSYVQNDTLFAGQTPDSRYVYSANSLPIDRSSLAGYAAATGEPLVIDDVYDIQSNVSYAFNPEFDTRSNYRTKSMLIIPLKTRDGGLVGVLQLINAIDDTGTTIPFSYQDTTYAEQFAQHAADAIERARLSREMVLRMVELSGLRDPFETGQHAKRVGAYAVELYDKWATGAGI
ncbi:MAG: GAF domain-containing protein, partial [Spirochaetota bacterium]